MSAHFARREFACPHCNVSLVRDRLVDSLERLRSMRGKPILIVSGYRCPVHNAAVGGALDSQHMYAAAVDVRAGVCSIEEAEAAGFVGIGTSGGKPVHLDVRDGPPARWSYSAH